MTRISGKRGDHVVAYVEQDIVSVPSCDRSVDVGDAQVAGIDHQMISVVVCPSGRATDAPKPAQTLQKPVSRLQKSATVLTSIVAVSLAKICCPDQAAKEPGKR